jgi:pimeloyl-ACP methyl ester carboxylesterase
MGWRGNIYRLQWNAGNFSNLLHELRALLIPVPGPWPVKVGVKLTKLLISSLNCWVNACEIADNTGPLLADSLYMKRPAWAYNELHLVGFSLGCRLLYAALEHAAKRGKVIADSFSMYAAAAPFNWNWEAASAAIDYGIINYFSQEDLILKYLYGVSNLFSNVPAGLVPVNKANSNIQDVDLSQTVSGHLKYEKEVTQAAFQHFIDPKMPIESRKA